MRNFLICAAALLVFSCNDPNPTTIREAISLSPYEVESVPSDSTVESGVTYLSTYSEVYIFTDSRTLPLTTMISMRNPSMDDAMYLTSAKYYNTQGDLVKDHLTKPLKLDPQQTATIVIDQLDWTGGPGSNMLFNWSAKMGGPEPIFEALMLNVQGQQGISFRTVGKRIK